mmetsp:Transcript_53204/g.59460  ORF Transcript_53204/g.59460 Transcript_53204/m.59460 type:complete len:267 (+) Transcript_53204:139-939(+)
MMLTMTKEYQRQDNEMTKKSQRKPKDVSYTVIGIDRTVLKPSSHDNLVQIHSKASDHSKEKDLDKLDRMLPGVLAEGIAYTVNSVIVQGYIDKKGSGFDWIGSRAWKARWAVLVWARTDGHHIDVPLLEIFWNFSSPSPSTVISLDSAVLLPENNIDPTESSSNHPFRFKIRHVKKSVNPENSVQMTRIFSCSEISERDQWVYSINQALLNYEKEKAGAKRLNPLSLSPPRGTSRSWAKEVVMPQSDRQLNKSTRTRYSTPPLVPS